MRKPMIVMKTAIYTALLTFLVISILLGSVGLLCGKWIIESVADTVRRAGSVCGVSEYLFSADCHFCLVYNALSAMFNALGAYPGIPHCYFLVFTSIFNVGRGLDFFMVMSLHIGEFPV